MLLTPIPPEHLPAVLAQFDARLPADPTVRGAFRRIAATWPVQEGGVDRPEHREAAVHLAHRLGIATLDEEPALAFSWDGVRLRTRSEATVILHEIAHWQLCPPDRRRLPDFGLGAGPETGLRAAADAALCVSQQEQQEEEALTSLLGILWEAALGQPAILAFLEQNWLEGHDRPAAIAHFSGCVETLRNRGLIGTDGLPVVAVIGAVAPDCCES